MSVLPVGMGSSGGYEIPYSLRFRASNSAYLSRTPSASNRTTWTWSAWVKRGKLGAYQGLFGAQLDGNNTANINFDNADKLYVEFTTSSTGAGQRVTSAVFRDPTAHFHVVVAVDTTLGSNRIKIYINGTEAAYSSTTEPSASYQTWINSANGHKLGTNSLGAGWYFDGYLSEINFIDGQALTPSSFGETNSDGVWVPKKYTGTYGTNGFYLDFKDGNLTSGSNTGLGKDVSGNGNYWNTNGVSVTSGVTYDWMYDTPTNNYAVLNPLAVGPYATLSYANLRITGNSATNSSFSYSPIGVTSGKWYYEVTGGSTFDASHFGYIGVATKLDATSLVQEVFADYRTDGTTFNTGASTAGRPTWQTSGNVVACAIDADNGAIYFRDSTGAWIASGDPTSGASRTGAITTFTAGSKTLYAGGGVYQNTYIVDANFGQRPFTYTPPTGFKSLCTANLPAVTITNPRKHFDVNLRVAGGASGYTKSGLGFQPDMLWSKTRGISNDHYLFDAIRGASKYVSSNLTAAESTAATFLTSFNTDGYTFGSGDYSVPTGNIVEWLWKANGAGVTNTAGSITSTVSANTTAGFSIVTYTGTGANATVGHGLGKVPSLIIVKDRTSGSRTVDQWPVYHNSLAVTSGEHLYLYSTAAKATSSTVFQSTLATSSVFSVGTWGGINYLNDTYVAYVFAEIPSFSKFGSYTGNGSTDGPFVFCGFRPRWVLVKSSAGVVSDWILHDTVRDTYNLASNQLSPNLSLQEGGSIVIDIVSNGFKVRHSTGNYNNASGTYIFAAFAEYPFGGSNIAPSPAR